MKNRKLLLVVSLVLAMTMSLGGTLAYLTDTDADVNVMTLGNVQIEQHEYERVVGADGNYETIEVTKADDSTQESYKLQEFTQNKPLLPAVGDPDGGYTDTYARFEQLGDPEKVQGGQQFLSGIKNGQDKIVMVENTGKTDAYVRTIFAYEMGSKTVAEWSALVKRCTGNAGEPWAYTNIGKTTIDGNNYYIVEAVYTGYSYGNMRHNGGILPAGEWTYNSLAEIYVVSTATNEDLAALDGNGNGTYDILVVSQAVQAAGFEASEDKTAAEVALDEAFGAISVEEDNESHPWMDWDGKTDEEGDQEPDEYTVVNNAAALTAALQAGESVILTNDVTIGEIDLTNVANNVVINANGKTITTTEAYGIQTTPGKDVTVSNAEVVMTKDGTSATYAAGFKIENGDYQGATIKLENCTITMANGDWAYAVNMPAGVKNLNLVIDNCVLEGAIAVQCWGDNNTITITNSKLICNYTTNATFTSYCVALQSDETYVAEGNTLVIDDCEFSYSGIDNFNKEIYSVEDFGTNNTVTVKNCTYGEKVVQ